MVNETPSNPTEASEPKDSAEEVEFQMPEFDEETYIQQEIRDARLALATLGYAMAAAVATRFVVAGIGIVGIGFLFGLALGYGLKPLFQALGADLEELEWKNWAGTGAIYFFAWLGFWTLLLNPPFV